jgi:CubicO group peptidase (beta-lactamase class C family)
VKQAAGQVLRERGSSNYSNLGGALLGQLLAIAAKTDFASLLSTRIFQPLGMTDTAVSTRSDCAPWADRGGVFPGSHGSWVDTRRWVASTAQSMTCRGWRPHC